MPGPRGLPRDTVRPEVSECSRIERSRRPTSTATSAWPPSWTTVRPRRTRGQVAGPSTSSSATAPVARTKPASGTGWVDVARSQTSDSMLSSGEAVGPNLAVLLEARLEQDRRRRVDPALDQRDPAARGDTGPQAMVEEGAVDAGVDGPRGSTAAPQSRSVSPATM